ncbi:MAG TPA: efflux RND transporter periplasmic adaptor subunit [Candidatus Limnocylindrales bacterium]
MKLKLLAIVALLVIGGAALLVAVGGFPRGAAAAVTYLTSTATVTDVSNDVASTGSIAAATSWSLAFGSAPTTGDASSSDSSSSNASNGSSSGTWTVSKVDVKVGDTVKAKQVLATGTNATLSADITSAKNTVTSSGLQLIMARDSYDSAVDADDTDQIRQARIQLLNAQNAYDQAKASLKDLQDTAAHASLVAPAAGIVTAVNVTAGADAPSGAAITVDSTSYQVTADVVESDISAIQLGQSATVSVSSIGADLDGKVAAIAPTAASSSSSSSVVSFAVTIDVTSPPATLKSGMSADITITTASASNVLAVPAAAIRGSNGNYSVLVLQDGQPVSTPVQVGLMTSSLVEVKSGLNEGDVVVTGTSSQQRSSGTVTNGFVVPGGGGGRTEIRGGNGGG